MLSARFGARKLTLPEERVKPRHFNHFGSSHPNGGLRTHLLAVLKWPGYGHGEHRPRTVLSMPVARPFQNGQKMSPETPIGMARAKMVEVAGFDSFLRECEFTGSEPS